MKTLRTKFIFWISVLFILIGTFIFVSLSIILPEKITAQILKRDIRIAQYLSREVQDSLLVNNNLTLKLLLEDRLDNLQDAVYVFVRGSGGNIIASTFEKGFPKGLLSLNNGSFDIKKSGEEAYNVEKFLANNREVYDIAVPLLKGELGTLHMGVSSKSSKTEIAEFSRINYYVASVIFIGLGMGVLIFSFLGIFLSNRIIRLKDFAVKVGNGGLDERIDINTKDELGSLAVSLNEMVNSLREKIETIKRLSYLEERNRLAFDLHDGLAQNLADIIKRLELCQRLLKLEPSRAKEELEGLKKNTNEVLNNVRQTILNLKLTQEGRFDLNESLVDYVTAFQKENNIKVKLNITGLIGNIAPDKSRIIFSIIREALTNIRKHSAARNAAINLVSNNGVLNANIQDEGKGFIINESEISAGVDGKFGIISMLQRASSVGGLLTICSKPGEGTDVSVNIPLKKEER